MSVVVCMVSPSTTNSRRGIMRTMGMMVAWMMATSVLAACSSEAKKAPPPPMLSERLGLRAPPEEKLPVGGDCTAFEGSSGCASNLCLRLTPGFPPRGVCSMRCGAVEPTSSLNDGGLSLAEAPTPDVPCPIVEGRQWVCEQILPRRSGFVCVPPRSALGIASSEAVSALTDGGVQ